MKKNRSLINGITVVVAALVIGIALILGMMGSISHRDMWVIMGIAAGLAILIMLMANYAHSSYGAHFQHRYPDAQH